MSRAVLLTPTLAVRSIPQVNVRLSKFQVGEIAHKATIVRDEPDLLASYDLTEGEGERIAAFFLAAKAGELLFPLAWADMVINELEDLNNMYLANWKDCGDQDAGGAYRSVCGAIKKLKASVAARQGYLEGRAA